MAFVINHPKAIGIPIQGQTEDGAMFQNRLLQVPSN